ncbi:6-pyruvoyl tetrahydropterin synthase [Rufibacter sp. DG15C]|uniref:6-pyruvoyl trahydropterin synthase family protein n=1 Tax=Rufibacter sp. DG15C TaxID=1379909 RepID=UPI00078BBED5|nr:6-carboxytetrahydropterin synthase [Rufibacter sp. DG15C]AMM50129.1 6-pyruvoyl tetrahydropterin synthase [Rufibacter sp. DG15C]
MSSILIRLTRRFTFEAAHALDHYDGACRHIHGHSYKLEVTVLGKPLQDEEHPKDGMVLDFGELKKLVSSYVLQDFDHALILQKDSDLALIELLQVQGHKLLLTAWQPTCENMLLHIKDQLQPQLPEHVTLHSLKLWETENAYGEWHAADNA